MYIKIIRRIIQRIISISMFQISLSIPLNRELPDIISKFSPDENFLMIEIGSTSIQKIKNGNNESKYN